MLPVVWSVRPDFIRLDCMGKCIVNDADSIPIIVNTALGIISRAEKYKGHPISEDILYSERDTNSVSFSLLFETHDNMMKFLRTLNPLSP